MAPEPAAPQEIKLNWQTAVRLGHAIRNFATSEVGGRAAALAIVAVAADGTWTQTETKEIRQ
jgi:hypothetical protein